MVVSGLSTTTTTTTTTTPTPIPHHSIFYRLDALRDTQPTGSKHRKAQAGHLLK